MSRRIDIELTSALSDNSWTWRAAGAKQPKGTLDGSILPEGAAVGDIVKVEVEQEIDGITVVSVVGGRQKAERNDLIELLPSERDFKPVIETRAKRERGDRGGKRDERGGDRRPRRDDRKRDGGRDGKSRDGKSRDGRDDRGDRSDRGRGDGRRRDGRGRGGPSFTPPPEIPKRPKPKRLRPGKQHRTAVLAEIPEEQRGVAEVALQGMGAVRQRLREENDKAAADGRSPMPEATVLKMAEDLLPRLRVAEWRDRAEAAQRQMEHLDLRDLRSVVAAAGDPAVARDESTSALAAELTSALATKQEHELALWFGDVDAALAVGRVIRALRLSSQPPKAGVPFPADIAQRLIDSTNASLAPMDSPDRWIAMLEAAAFSPVRSSVAPVRKPDVVNDDLLATVKRLAPALPQVAALFEIEVDPKASMPKPLRPGPRNRPGAKTGERSRGSKGGGSPDRQREGSRRDSKGEQRRGKRGPAGAPNDRAENPTATASDKPAKAAAPDTASAPAPATPSETPTTDTPAEPAHTAAPTPDADEAPPGAGAPASTETPAPTPEVTEAPPPEAAETPAPPREATDEPPTEPATEPAEALETSSTDASTEPADGSMSEAPAADVAGTPATPEGQTAG